MQATFISGFMLVGATYCKGMAVFTLDYGGLRFSITTYLHILPVRRAESPYLFLQSKLLGGLHLSCKRFAQKYKNQSREISTGQSCLAYADLRCRVSSAVYGFRRRCKRVPEYARRSSIAATIPPRLCSAGDALNCAGIVTHSPRILVLLSNSVI